MVSHTCNPTFERLPRRAKSSRSAWAELDLVSKIITRQQPQQKGAKEQGNRISNDALKFPLKFPFICLLLLFLVVVVVGFH